MDREQKIATLELHGWRPMSKLMAGNATPLVVCFHDQLGVVVPQYERAEAKLIPSWCPELRKPREWGGLRDDDLERCYCICMEASYGSTT